MKIPMIAHFVVGSKINMIKYEINAPKTKQDNDPNKRKNYITLILITLYTWYYLKLHPRKFGNKDAYIK